MEIEIKKRINIFDKGIYGVIPVSFNENMIKNEKYLKKLFNLIKDRDVKINYKNPSTPIPNKEIFSKPESLVVDSLPFEPQVLGTEYLIIHRRAVELNLVEKEDYDSDPESGMPDYIFEVFTVIEKYENNVKCLGYKHTGKRELIWVNENSIASEEDKLGEPELIVSLTFTVRNFYGVRNLFHDPGDTMDLINSVIPGEDAVRDGKITKEEYLEQLTDYWKDTMFKLYRMPYNQAESLIHEGMDSDSIYMIDKVINYRKTWKGFNTQDLGVVMDFMITEGLVERKDE